jgi:tetratricopeptide (TPR) repeat protein
MKYALFSFILLCTSLTAQQTDYDRAWIAYTSGRYEEALVAIQQCITNDTANYQFAFLKGKTLENLYRYDEAIATQRNALRLNPGSIDAQAALATLYLLSGQPAVSAQLYGQLAAAEPQVNRWKMNWATALLSSGKPRDALEQLIIVEQTDTANWVVYKNMGDCYYRIDSLMRTYDCYEKALELYPYNKNLYGTLTRILAVNKEEEGAIVIGTQAITIDSTNVEAWKYLGVAWYNLGITQKAHEAFGKAIALGDSSNTTCSHYGALYHHMGNYHDAEKYLIRAYQLDPNNMINMRYLAANFGYTGKAKKGLEILDELDNMIAKIDTLGMQANIQRGYLLRTLYRYNDAAKVFIVATKDFPKNSRNFYEVAVCYDMARNKKQALDWYTRYLDMIDPKWATKQWEEKELKKLEFVKTAMERVKSLKTDLFFEEEKR